MTVIELTRELGAALQKDERYLAYLSAKEKNDTDGELQNLIGEFNIVRMKYGQQMQKSEEEQDKELMTQLDNEMRDIYGKIMSNENMNAYNDAKEAMDKLLNSINFIITMAANGEDPMTCPEEQPHSCSGSCASCGGCH
ncbi:MAG: YlbF family regulator [Oscillospiraceae bacterium]|nr:YlbF family regulator [Oscillospiraceae bacterium]